MLLRMSEEWDPASQIPAELREWGIETVLRGLVEDENLWRQRVGDEDYEHALEYWRRAGYVSDYPLMTVVWVLMTGARTFWQPEVVRGAFDAIEAKWGWHGPGPYTFRLVHGACPLRPVKLGGRVVDASADMLADTEARRRPNWEVVESAPGVAGFPADFDGPLGRAAGPKRNAQMVRYLLAQDGPKEVVGFPLVATKQHPKGTTSGTAGCLTIAENAGLDWWVAPLDMNTEDAWAS